MSYTILNSVKYWNQVQKYPYKILNPAPIKYCSQIPYNMALNYLGLKNFEYPPPPFSNRIWKSEGVQCLKKTLIKDMKIRGGSKFNSHNNSKSLYNMMWKSEGRTIFCSHNISKRLWKSGGGGQNISQKPLSCRILKSDGGSKHFSHNILKSLSSRIWKSEYRVNVLQPHYILRKYQTNK